MNEIKRKMKKAEEEQKAKQIIREFDTAIAKINNSIGRYRELAKDALGRNDINSFKQFGKSMKYCRAMVNSLQTIKCQFENYLIQVDIASTFVGLKNVLASTAKMMDSMPSLKRNNKDFMKFKKSLLKGQISMDSITSMMNDMDPSSDTEMTEDEIKALKDEILMTSGSADVKIGATTETNKNTSNDDFFKELDV